MFSSLFQCVAESVHTAIQPFLPNTTLTQLAARARAHPTALQGKNFSRTQLDCHIADAFPQSEANESHIKRPENQRTTDAPAGCRSADERERVAAPIEQLAAWQESALGCQGKLAALESELVVCRDKFEVWQRNLSTRESKLAELVSSVASLESKVAAWDGKIAVLESQVAWQEITLAMPDVKPAMPECTPTKCENKEPKHK